MDGYRQILETVALNLGGWLFGLGLGVAVITGLATWSRAIVTARDGETASSPILATVLLRLVLRLPTVGLWGTVAVNLLVFIFALGLVRADEVMAPPGHSSSVETRILVWRLPIATITLGRARHIAPESGRAFVYVLPRVMPFRVVSDGPYDPTASSTIVSENGRRLGRPHSIHDAIRHDGRGRYSHWGDGWLKRSTVYFSTIDNTSPLQNGRVYAIRYVLDLPPGLTLLIVLFSVPVYLRIAIALGLARRRQPDSRPLVVAALCPLGLVAFVIPLVVAWRVGRTTPSLIGGLLPWSDASGWLHGTYYFLHAHSLFWWTMRRPLNPAFTSFLAAVTGEDLSAMLVVRTLLTGLVTLLVATVIWRRYGAGPGLAVFALLLAVVSPFTPTTLTEALGFAFGVIAFSLMWQAIAADDIRRFCAGLFLLTLALTIRPGPFLVLPVLALWATISFGERRRGIVWRLGLLVVAGSAALSITALWNYFYGTSQSHFSANYAFTFYGLTVGGKSWQQFFIDHPEAASLPEAAQSALAYRLGFAEILRRPSALIGGLASFTTIYLESLFIYVEPPKLRRAARWVALLGLVVVGFRSRRDPHCSFLLWGAGGTALSAPLMFWSTDASRAFIATATFEGTLASMGLALISGVLRSPTDPRRTTTPQPATWPGRAVCIATMVVTGCLIVGCSVGPVVALALHRTPVFEPFRCEGGLEPSVIHLGRSSPFIEIVSDDATIGRHAGRIRQRDFLQSTDFGSIEIGEVLMQMRPGDLLIHGFDFGPPGGHARFQWLFASTAQLPVPDRYYAVCGTTRRFPSNDPVFPVTFVKSAREVTLLPR